MPISAKEVIACCRHLHRDDFRGEPESAHLPRMIAKCRLERDPPIWRHATDRALTSRIYAEKQLSVGRQWPIASELEIEHVVKEGIGAEADDLLRVELVDKCGGGGHRREGRTDIRKPPGRDRVPHILQQLDHEPR
jgi:hypothetical protein